MIRGPLTDAELRSLIGNGQMKNSDLIRSGVNGAWAAPDTMNVKPSPGVSPVSPRGRVLPSLSLPPIKWMVVIGVVALIIFVATIAAFHSRRETTSVSNGARNIPTGTDQSELSGGAWIVLPDGESSLLRGLQVVMLRRQVPKSQVSAEVNAIRDDVSKLAALEDGPSIEVLTLKMADENYNMALANGDPPDRLKELHRNADEARQAVEDRTVRSLRLHAIVRAVTTEFLPIRPDQPVNVDWLYHLARRYESRPLIADKVLPHRMNDLMGNSLWLAVVEHAKLASTTTGIDGRYAFNGLSRGKYFLFASQNSGSTLIEWLVPIDLSETNGTPSNRLDLQTSNAAIVLHRD